MSVFFPEHIRQILRDAADGKQYIDRAGWWADQSYQEIRD